MEHQGKSFLLARHNHQQLILMMILLLLTIQVQGQGGHSHNMSANFSGDATSVLQPYLTIIYIIKT